jgi:hypothetical protein
MRSSQRPLVQQAKPTPITMKPKLPSVSTIEGDPYVVNGDGLVTNPNPPCHWTVKETAVASLTGGPKRPQGTLW